MVFRYSRSIYHRKKGLVYIVIYGIFTFCFICYLKSKIYPENEDCFVYEDTNVKSVKSIDKIETNLKNFLSKYSNFHTLNESDDWTEIAKNVFIYSVYIDKCPTVISLSSSCLQFIGITLMNITGKGLTTSNFRCAFKRGSNITKLGFAFIEKLPEHHFKPYTAIFSYCKLKDFSADSSSVDYATLYKFSISRWLQVNYLSPKTLSNIAINLCVRPFYGLFSSIYMIEFLAYYKNMGVEHFIFYHHNVSESMFLFLEYLKSTNLSIEVHPWNMPLNNNLIHEYGQIVFTQDCIVRSRYKFSHTIIVDIDEFIVPKVHPNITTLISHLDAKYKNAGSYVISMVLFCDEFTNNTSSSSLFPILNNNKRQRTPWYHGYRSKYIVRSDRVLHGGIHFVWNHQKSWYEVKVSSSLALLHHYRHCCGLLQTWFFHLFSFSVLSDDIVIDNSLIKKAHKVVNDSLTMLVLNLSDVASVDK